MRHFAKICAIFLASQLVAHFVELFVSLGVTDSHLFLYAIIW